MREMRYDDPRNDDQAPSNVLNIIKSNPNPPQYTIIFNFQFVPLHPHFGKSGAFDDVVCM